MGVALSFIVSGAFIKWIAGYSFVADIVGSVMIIVGIFGAGIELDRVLDKSREGQKSNETK